MTPDERLIARLMTVFGEPRTDDPILYIEEFRKAIRGWDADLLERAGDDVIRSSKFWPRPAEIIEKLEAASRQREARKPPKPREPDLPPPTPEQVARSRKVLAMAMEAMSARKMKQENPAPVPYVSRPAFEEMMRCSPNRGLYVDHRALTRRITGERDE